MGRGRLSLRHLWAFMAIFALGAAASQADVLITQGGTRYEGKVQEEKDEYILNLPNGGRMKFPKAMVQSVTRSEDAPSPAGTKESAAPEKPRPPSASPHAKPGPWSEAEERKVEDALNRFFAAKDEAARRAIYGELENTKLDRRFEDLDRMREVALKKGLLRHVEVPWRKGAPRAWYNIAIPNDYTPEKAWPLVLALHGMPADGDNLVSWYSAYFPPLGYIVLFPTTIHPSSFWPSPDEKMELLRLVRHVSTLYRLDYRRLYCTGASGGGIGTWHWLATLPELFAGGISFSAAGTIFDKRLEKLKGVPFYVHHGSADAIPVDSVRASVDLARRYGATIEFYVSEGTGHTPPEKDWQRSFDWLVKLAANKASPRYLLESPEGALLVGYPRDLPFAVAPEADAIAKIYADYKAKAPAWQFPAQVAGDDLVAGLLDIAMILDPGGKPEPVRDGIKRIAEAVRKKQKPDGLPADTLYVLNEVFFQTEGFSRDGADPTGDSPEGFAVDRLLKLHRGNVFALTGLYVAVAGELGLPVFAVTSPYHAFAWFDDGKEAVNVEMTEAGGHFGDAVYTVGYGLRNLSSARTVKAKGTPMLLAAQLAALGNMARRAGQPDKAAAAARLALTLDPDCFRALLLEAHAAKEAKQSGDALKSLDRLVRAWPDYAEPRLLQGEILAESGSGSQAVEAYSRGVSARLKPYGATAAVDAELYYRIAAIWAPMAREALKVQKLSAVTYMNKFNEAIVAALRNNPSHPGARRLLEEMGGRIH
jgi:predicted esterase/tetratricopeptide (TPR) repeat protein